MELAQVVQPFAVKLLGQQWQLCEHHRLLQHRQRVGGRDVGLEGRGHQAFVTSQVQVDPTHVNGVAACHGRDEARPCSVAGLELLAQDAHVALQRRLGAARSRPFPQHRHEAVFGHRGSTVQDQCEQDAAKLGAAEVPRPHRRLAGSHAQSAQHVDTDAGGSLIGNLVTGDGAVDRAVGGLSGCC